MFEISVASKYLIPRRRQLSVSIISLISVFVIALVVWLIVVFFSVTNGLEKNWISKLITLTAPVRVTPTDAYYHSYYHLIDTISEESGYASKSIGEKLISELSDPYNPDVDEEIPHSWPESDRYPDGTLKDLVKILYQSIDTIAETTPLRAREFQLTGTHINIQLHRQTPKVQGHNIYPSTTSSELAYPAYLGNFESDNTPLKNTLLPISEADLSNYLNQLHQRRTVLSEAIESSLEDNFREEVHQQIVAFFDLIEVQRLRARLPGWTIPPYMIPHHCRWEACAIINQDRILRIIIPQEVSQTEKIHQGLDEQGLTSAVGHFTIEDDEFFFENGAKLPLPKKTVISLAGGTLFQAKIVMESVEEAQRAEEIEFHLSTSVQGHTLSGKVPYRNLEIHAAAINDGASDIPWVHEVSSNTNVRELTLPQHQLMGEGVILPKNFKDAGVLLGDRGTLSYLAPTMSLVQEQFIPIYIAGFYDPGIIPIGGKFILASSETTAQIRAAHEQDSPLDVTNGVNIRLASLDQAVPIKEKLQEALKRAGISRYWTVESYKDYEFTREIMQELQSQKHLFMLIAIVIIVVACSNIISMLIILVNDKKTEIGILRSMGATSTSIALIFGAAGAIIGILGSVIGISMAIFTLNHLDTLISWLSHLQGHEMFSASLYGQVLPSELSFEALAFVLAATGAISLLAGVVPAVKACLLKPSQILRSTGE